MRQQFEECLDTGTMDKHPTPLLSSIYILVWLDLSLVEVEVAGLVS